jgi:hypothetical protein
MLLESVMGTHTGTQWAKALYMASLGQDGEQPLPSSHAWTDAGHLKPQPREGQDRPSRMEATSWLPRGSASRSALFPDGLLQQQTQVHPLIFFQQQMQQQHQQQQQPDDVVRGEEELTDFVFKMRKNPQGGLELFCETCHAWCGDDPQYSGHLGSKKHRDWEVYFEKQKKFKSAFRGSTPASVGTPSYGNVGTPSYGCCGPPQRSFAFGSDAAVPADFVTHEELQRRFEQIRSCGAEAEKITDEGMTKMYNRQEKQQQCIEKQQQSIDKQQQLIEKQQQVIEKQLHKILELDSKWHGLCRAVGELQDIVRREIV